MSLLKRKRKVPKILFILRHRTNSFDCDRYTCQLGSGLLTSTKFVVEMLKDKLGYNVHVFQAVDNNSIDRFVTKFKPDICIIEAYWVIPSKFKILTKLHPNVKWVIHNHSALPFISLEGIVIDWTLDYMNYPNVIIGCNEFRTTLEFRQLIQSYKPDWSREKVEQHCVFLPNYYPEVFYPRPQPSPTIDKMISIGCFGAVRPLKNQLIQAVAAMSFAENLNRKLHFHINATRKEGGGDPILKNIRSMFSHISQHQLIEHPWLEHDEFVKIMRVMDVSMQCSFSETFNIVTADAVMNDVPVVTSPEIKWVDPRYYAEPTDSRSIANALHEAHGGHHNHTNVRRLFQYNGNSVKHWEEFVSVHR